MVILILFSPKSWFDKIVDQLINVTKMLGAVGTAAFLSVCTSVIFWYFRI